MTPERAEDVLREIRALERHAAVIRLTLATSSEGWQFALTAIDDRVRLLRACLGCDHDPLLMASVDELQPHAEIPTARPRVH